MILAFKTTVWSRCRRSPAIPNVLNAHAYMRVHHHCVAQCALACVHARPTAETPKPALSRNSLYRYEFFFWAVFARAVRRQRLRRFDR